MFSGCCGSCQFHNGFGVSSYMGHFLLKEEIKKNPSPTRKCDVAFHVSSLKCLLKDIVEGMFSCNQFVSRILEAIRTQHREDCKSGI